MNHFLTFEGTSSYPHNTIYNTSVLGGKASHTHSQRSLYPGYPANSMPVIIFSAVLFYSMTNYENLLQMISIEEEM